MTTITVRETIRHGAFNSDRTETIEASPASVAAFLAASDYHYSEVSGERAETVLADLLAKGEASHGWSWLSVEASPEVSEYAARCLSAATAQGLDPVTEALAAAGVQHEVEQTGGFTMVVTVPGPRGVLALTAEADDEVYAAMWPRDLWSTGSVEGCEYWEDPDYSDFEITLAEAVALGQRHAAGEAL